MTSKLSNLISEYPYYFGSLFLLLGIILLAYNLKNKKSFNMDNYNIAGWDALINSWALTLLLFIFGISLII